MSDGSLSPDAKIERLIEEVAALRTELAELRREVGANRTPNTEAEGSLQRAYAEYRKLPDRSEEAFRWGFLGAWGSSTDQGAQRACMSVNTTTIESFLSRRNEEEVAQFAAVFTNAATLRICRCVFRHGGRARKQDITGDCGLDDEALLRAMKPLLEWHLVEWNGDWLEACGQGVNYAITLTGMAIEAYKQRSNNYDE
jgi:hypothetical protein